MFPADYYGNNMKPLIGIVEDLVDEAFVKVRVFGIHPINKEDVTTEMLPKALVIYPVTGGQVSSGSISHNIEIDSWVFGYWVDYPICQQPIVTGVIQGSEYSMSTYKSGGGEFVEQGVDGTSSVDVDATTNIPGGSNIQKAYNYVYSRLMKEGSSSDAHLHASAVCGVLMLETSGINPAVVGGYKGRAWGICQWLGNRRSQLFNKYGRTKRLDNQLDFMWWELNNTERRAKGLWLRSTNLPDAVAGFASFERAEEWQGGRINRAHGNFKKRLQYAYQVYNTMKKTGEITTASAIDTRMAPGGQV